ncbi:hypothetical protein BDP67DRAFT_493606 [Colletotrichum lupini]|nr:hypothetical protein BDP67DRAFT_493606 [Colletotrichum lupini]
MHAEATGLRQQPSTFKMNDLVSLPPGIKSEDIPIPSRESSREFSLPFRPSPAVTANKIRDLVQLFTNARMNYLQNPSVSKLPCLADRQNCRLLKSIDRYIAFKADKFSTTDMLQFEAKDRWMNCYRVRRYQSHQDIGPVHPAPAPLALMASTTSMINLEAIIALMATYQSKTKTWH